MFDLRQLDDIDKKILEILQINAKITNSQLAKEIGLSPAPTLERVKKLEHGGLIKSYHAEIDTTKIGLGVSVFLQASLLISEKGSIEAFEEKIKKIPEIIECYHITGSSDFMLKILTKNIESYNKFILERLIHIEQIGNMQSMVVLSTLKDSKAIPI